VTVLERATARVALLLLDLPPLAVHPFLSWVTGASLIAPAQIACPLRSLHPSVPHP